MSSAPHEHPAEYPEEGRGETPSAADAPTGGVLASAERLVWLQRLEEAAARPAGDPRRTAVEEAVAARGGWAQAHWTGLLAENAAWQATLATSEPPDGLQQRLRTISAGHGRRTLPLRGLGRHRWLLGAAALLLAAVGLYAVWGSPWSAGDGPLRTPLEERLHEVALLALGDHLDTHQQDVLASDPAILARDLQARIPFPLDLPRLGGEMHAVGGRRCTLGSHTVAFTAWRAPHGRLTLLQLRRADFGLPADMAQRIIHPDGHAARGNPLDVLFFGRGDFVWVVVADDADDLRRVSAAVAHS